MINKLIKKFAVLGLVVLNLVGLMGKGVYADGGSEYDPYQDQTNPIIIVRSKEFDQFKRSFDPFWFYRSCMLPFHMRSNETSESYYGLSDEEFQILRTHIYNFTTDYFKNIGSKVEDDSDFIRVRGRLDAYFGRPTVKTSNGEYIDSSDIYIKEKIDITDSFCSLLFNTYMGIILKATYIDDLDRCLNSVTLLNNKLSRIGKHMEMFFPHEGHDDCLTRHDSTYMKELPEKVVLYRDVLSVIKDHFHCMSI